VTPLYPLKYPHKHPKSFFLVGMQSDIAHIGILEAGGWFRFIAELVYSITHLSSSLDTCTHICNSPYTTHLNRPSHNSTTL